MFEMSREEVELHWMAAVRKMGRVKAEFAVMISAAMNSKPASYRKYLKTQNEIGLILDSVMGVVYDDPMMGKIMGLGDVENRKIRQRKVRQRKKTNG